ncbi:MAG: mannose-1-phosphate guanylyltransferase [Balneolaceae bacterium]|nr:mannose-1-phosphate guanylyltransferase [Balneolaceae bacterium]
MLHAVIMAGGSGTRFWPRSTQKKPKQFLNIFGKRTMLQATADRIDPLVPSERIWVITNEKYVDLVADQLPDVPKNNIIGEPVAKNTAPCVALAAALIQKTDPEGTMLVLPADHLINDSKTFLSIVKTAEEKAEDKGSLITIGIKPSHPETGYGYIECETGSGNNIKGNEVNHVVQFREKPDAVTAKAFISAGNFLWNSGMFVWKASTIIDEFKNHLPEIYKNIKELNPKIGSDQEENAISRFYHACSSVSIDYGIMEQADRVFVVPGEIGWNDVGSWNAVYELREKDEQGNVTQTEWPELVNASDNLIHSESGKVIALVGVENLAIVETDDAILVCNLDQAQDVRQVVESLKKKKETQKFL